MNFDQLKIQNINRAGRRTQRIRKIPEVVKKIESK